MLCPYISRKSLLLSALCGVFCLLSTLTDAQPLSEKVLFFTSDFSSNRDIWMSNPDGTDLEQLTTHPNADEGPVFSPDGTKVAFVRVEDNSSDTNVYVLDLTSGGPPYSETQLTFYTGMDGDTPAWSPDGTEIAFGSDRSGVRAIWKVPVLGGNPCQVTFPSLQIEGDSEPDWRITPDGPRLLFTRFFLGAAGDIKEILLEPGTCPPAPNPPPDTPDTLVPQFDNSFQEHNARYSDDGMQVAWTHFLTNATGAIYIADRANVVSTRQEIVSPVSNKGQFVGDWAPSTTWCEVFFGAGSTGCIIYTLGQEDIRIVNINNQAQFDFPHNGAVTDWGTFSETPPCEIRTDYDAGGCVGTFQAASLADLDDYVASNFGKNGGTNFQNLKITADIDNMGNILDVESPCQITLSDNVVLTADFVSLDGRKGVIDDNGYTLNAQTACVLSEEDNAGLGAGSVVNVDALTVQGEKRAKIGQNSHVVVTGALSISSTGDVPSSDAIIKSGSVVAAGAIELSASRGAHLGQNTTITADTITLHSTGDHPGSDAGLNSGAHVTADALTISASRQAKVGQNTTVTLTGDLLVESTGSASGSLATVNSGSDITVGGAMDLVSGNKAKIGQSTTVDVTGNLNMDAAALNKCTVKGSAVVTFGSKSGVCAPVLP